MSLTRRIQVEAAQNYPPTITPTVIRGLWAKTRPWICCLMVTDPDTTDSLTTYRVSDIPSGITVS